jgi:chromosome segregation ATPase
MNKKELAQHIGIGKTTLYTRANKFDIDLNKPLTDEQIIALRDNSPVESYIKPEILQPTSNNLSEQQKENRPNTFEQSSEQLCAQNEQLSEQINKLFEQLSAKDEQIKNKDIQLSKAHETITTTQKLIDQSQQLQLDLQHQLAQSEQNKSQLLIENKELSEHLQAKNKSFWQKLFGI